MFQEPQSRDDFKNVSNSPSFSLTLLKKVNDRELQKQDLNVFINVTLASLVKVSTL